MITRFLLHIIANALAILASEWLVPGVAYKYAFISLLEIALILSLANAFVKPVIKLLAWPLIVLTLGLFTLLINVLIIWLVDPLIPEITIIGLNAYVWTMLIASALNFVVSLSTKEKAK